MLSFYIVTFYSDGLNGVSVWLRLVCAQLMPTFVRRGWSWFVERDLGFPRHRPKERQRHAMAALSGGLFRAPAEGTVGHCVRVARSLEHDLAQGAACLRQSQHCILIF